MRSFDGEVGLSSDHSEGDLSLAISALMEDESLGDPLRGNSWSDRIANTVSIDPETGALRYLMIDVAVRASSSEDTDAITDSFSNHVKWLEGDGECSCSAYLSGEIIVIESVLDGLFISQVESTALSLVASFFVLMAMTRRFSTSAVIISASGSCRSLGSWNNGCGRSKLECPYGHDHCTYDWSGD